MREFRVLRFECKELFCGVKGREGKGLRTHLRWECEDGFIRRFGWLGSDWLCVVCGYSEGCVNIQELCITRAAVNHQSRFEKSGLLSMMRNFLSKQDCFDIFIFFDH